MNSAMRNERSSGASRAVRTTIFSTSTPVVTSASCSAFSTRKSARSSMPIEMKNRLEKMSRKGTISANTWWRCSDSEMTRPASSAPIASDSPSCSASHAVPSENSTTVTVNTSRMRRLATWRSRPGSTKRAAAKMPTSTSNALPSTHRIVPTATPSLEASTGMRSIIGTMTRSWNTRMPVATRPCGESVWPRSAKILSATTVLECTAMKPSMVAGLQSRPATRASATTAPPITRICAAPASIRRPPRLATSPSDSSSPVTKSSRTMPSSARVSTSSADWMTAKPCGPSRTPATRNPTMLGTLSFCRTKTIGSVAASSTTRSRSIGVWAIRAAYQPLASAATGRGSGAFGPPLSFRSAKHSLRRLSAALRGVRRGPNAPEPRPVERAPCCAGLRAGGCGNKKRSGLARDPRAARLARACAERAARRASRRSATGRRTRSCSRRR